MPCIHPETPPRTRKGMKTKKPRLIADILNDIHEGYEVSLFEALRVIRYLEDELAKKEEARSKAVLDALEKLRMEMKGSDQMRHVIVGPPMTLPVHVPPPSPIEKSTITCSKRP